MSTVTPYPGVVAQIIAGARFGGAETFSVDCVLALAEAGQRQIVVTRPWPERLARLRGVPGLTVVPASLPFRLPPALGRIALRRLLRAHDPDAALPGRAPMLVQAWMGRAASIAPKGSIGWFGGYYDLKRYRRCTHLVAITPHMRSDMLARGADPARLSLIPTFAQLDDASALPRAALDTPVEAPLILCLARLHPKKGLDTLLEALARLPRAYLWLAGEGELEGTLRAQAEQLGVQQRVRWLGWRQDKGALLRAADVLAVPSRYEPFGTVVIEGWAAGTPVVAARAQGPAETIADGETGLLVPVDDAAALAAALGRVLEQPALAAALRDAAGAALQARYSRASVVAAYGALYARLGAERR